MNRLINNLREVFFNYLDFQDSNKKRLAKKIKPTKLNISHTIYPSKKCSFNEVMINAYLTKENGK